MHRIDEKESIIARERKKNNQLDCQITALKVDINDKHVAKDYLKNERDMNLRNER